MAQQQRELEFRNKQLFKGEASQNPDGHIRYKDNETEDMHSERKDEEPKSRRSTEATSKPDQGIVSQRRGASSAGIKLGGEEILSEEGDDYVSKSITPSSFLR